MSYRYMDWFELEYKFRRLRTLLAPQIERCTEGKEVGREFYEQDMFSSVSEILPWTLLEVVEILADE